MVAGAAVRTGRAPLAEPYLTGLVSKCYYPLLSVTRASQPVYNINSETVPNSSAEFLKAGFHQGQQGTLWTTGT